MAEFQREPILFDLEGINLAKPVDRLGPGEVRVAFNVRNYGPGRIQGRQGLELVSLSGTTGDPINSLYAWDDPIPNPSEFPNNYSARARLAGSGTALIGAKHATNPTAYQTIDTGFSGNPLSYVTSSSEFSQRPWTFIGDSEKIMKTASDFFPWQWGISPPNFAPTIAIDVPFADGPDIGASPNPYIYAFRARGETFVRSGARSALGPAVRIVNGLSPSSAPGAAVPPSSIRVTLPQLHPDPQVRYLDVYRFGGSLPEWIYVGTIQNVNPGTESFIDYNSDADIAGNDRADLDDNQPFQSVNTPFVATGTFALIGGAGSGTQLTITGGLETFLPYNATGFDPYMQAGNLVLAPNGQVFTMYRSPDSTTTVELLEDVTGGPFTDAFFILAPEVARRALPCIWGPFGGGLTGTFIFACGDAYRPGSLYWTEGNNPESHPGSNTLEITSPAEPLMNGCIYNGNNFVFSTKRAWVVYPTLGQVSDFSAIEIPNSKGLYARWGLCVTPHGIVFIGKDGIYLTTGGQPQSLTDETLYPLFPQESQNEASGQTVIDGLNGVTFASPDFTLPNDMRLTYGDGMLYFDYVDTEGTRRSLVYGFEQKKPGWISRDTYTPEITCRYFEQLHSESDETASWNKVVMGSTDGRVFQYGSYADNEEPILGHVRTGATDAQDPRPRKLWGDIELDLDAQCDTFDVMAGFDNYSFLSELSTTGTNLTGRHRAISDINSGQGQYGYNIGLDIQWSVTTSQPILYFWIPTRVDKPELTSLRVTDWEDGGYAGAKFVQGFILECDTLNVARTVVIQSDGGVSQQSFTVQASNQQQLAFSFTTPFISHLLRMWPQDANFWRTFKVRWIYEPAPELVGEWITQETTHDLPGYFFHRDGLVPVISSAAVTLSVVVNGNPASPFTYTVPSTSSLYLKQYVPLQAMKARAVQYKFTSSAGFRLFQRDLEFRVKAWGTDGPFQVVRPAGDLSRINGARI